MECAKSEFQNQGLIYLIVYPTGKPEDSRVGVAKGSQ